MRSGRRCSRWPGGRPRATPGPAPARRRDRAHPNGAAAAPRRRLRRRPPATARGAADARDLAAAPVRARRSPTTRRASATWRSRFRGLHPHFPKSDQADDAQVLIGTSYLMAGNYDKAVEAFDKAIRDYPTGNAIPDAYYRKGVALRHLGRSRQRPRGARVRRQDVSRQRRRPARPAAARSAEEVESAIRRVT